MPVRTLLFPFWGMLICLLFDFSTLPAQMVAYDIPNCTYQITTFPSSSVWLDYDCTTWTKSKGTVPTSCWPGIRFLWEYGDGNYSIYDTTFDCTSGTVDPPIMEELFLDKNPHSYASAPPSMNPYIPNVTATRIYTENNDPFNKVLRLKGSTASIGSCMTSGSTPQVSPLAGLNDGAINSSLEANNIHLQFPTELVVESEATLIVNYANISDNPNQLPFDGLINITYDPDIMTINTSSSPMTDLIRVYGGEIVNLSPGLIEIDPPLLPHGEYRNVFITFQTDTLQCPVPFEIEANLSGTYEGNIPFPTTTETYSGATNKSTDPNFKRVVPRYQTCDDEIDTLTYTIHFENVGRGPVQHEILVRDTIPSQLLIHTLDLKRITLAKMDFTDPSQHLFYYEPYSGGWIVEWTIRAPRILRGMNEDYFGLNPDYELAYGEIEYTINTSCGLKFGDKLNRQAVVYFDTLCGVSTQSQDSFFYAKKCLGYRAQLPITTVSVFAFKPFLTTPIKNAGISSILPDSILVLEQPDSGMVSVSALNDEILYENFSDLVLPVPDRTKIQIFKNGRSDILCLTFCNPPGTSSPPCNCNTAKDDSCMEQESLLPIITSFDDTTTGFSGKDCLAPTAIFPSRQQAYQFSVYPNPASNRVLVDHSEVPRFAWQQILLLNMQGQLLQQIPVQANGLTEISLDKLSSGLYLIQMGQMSQKLLIE
ncbi:MAG: T9SS type A sorting domain-containing protein [Bacteroidota bacterium]